jgi:hypothetical protein
MGCSDCSPRNQGAANGRIDRPTGADLLAVLSLSSPGGDADPATEVTTSLSVGQENAVSATVVVMALTTGTINVAIYGSNDLNTWIHLGDIADVSSIGSTIGQVTSVSTCYVRALVTLSTSADPAQCVVSLRLHLSSV